MTHRDYTKELGLPSTRKTIPRPLAYVILAVIAVGVFFGVADILRNASKYHAAENASDGSSNSAAVAKP